MSWFLRPIGRNLGTADKKMTRCMMNLLKKEQLFDRWCSSQKRGSDCSELRQLVLVEEFKRCVSSDDKSSLDEQGVETAEKLLV